MSRALNSHASKKKQQAIMTRLRCVELRLTGKSYQAIADHIGININTAYKHCKTAFESYHQKTIETAEMIVAEELQRCDRMLEGLWNDAIGGNVQSVGAVLKIMERKAKMLGLDKLPANDRSGMYDDDGPVTLVVVEEPEDVESWAAKYKESVSVNQEGNEA